MRTKGGLSKLLLSCWNFRHESIHAGRFTSIEDPRSFFPRLCIRAEVLAELDATPPVADMDVLRAWMQEARDDGVALGRQRLRAAGGVGGNVAGGRARGAGSAGDTCLSHGMGGKQAADKCLWLHKKTTPEHIFQMLVFFDVLKHIGSMSCLQHGAKAEERHGKLMWKNARYGRFARHFCFPDLQCAWFPTGGGQQWKGKDGKDTKYMQTR